MNEQVPEFLYDQRDLYQWLLRCQTFEETTSLLFRQAHLVDAVFLGLHTQAPSPDREIVYEALLRSRGLLEDPEVIGTYEDWLVDRLVEFTVPPDGPAWVAGSEPVPIPPEDLQSLLDLATRRMRLGFSRVASLLAVVHYAMRRVPHTAPVPGAPDSGAYLYALGDAARGRILVQVHGRAFDAVQYLRRAARRLEGLYERWEGVSKKPLETQLIRIFNQIADARRLLKQMKESR